MPILLSNEDGSYTPARTSSNARWIVLSESLLPDEISRELTLTPDRWWLRGKFQSVPKESWRRSRPNPFNGWELRSQLPESAPPDEHLLSLLERIGSAAPRVARLVANPAVKSVTLWVGHHTDNVNPGFSLSDALLRRLVPLGTGVELDIYAMVDEADLPANWQAALDHWNEQLAQRRSESREVPGSGKRTGTDRPDKALH